MIQDSDVLTSLCLQPRLYQEDHHGSAEQVRERECQNLVESKVATTESWAELKVVCTSVAEAWPQNESVKTLLEKVTAHHNDVSLEQRKVAVETALEPLWSMATADAIPQAAFEPLQVALADISADVLPLLKAVLAESVLGMPPIVINSSMAMLALPEDDYTPSLTGDLLGWCDLACKALEASM